MGHGPLKNEKVAEVGRNEEHGTDKLEITRVHEIRTLKNGKVTDGVQLQRIRTLYRA